MNHQDFRNLQQFRLDGRKPDEIRKLQMELSVDKSVDGSSYIKQGINEIMCQVIGPIPKQKKNQSDESFIRVDYSITPFSGLERRKLTKFDKNWSEFADNLRIGFESLIQAEVYQNSVIEINICIIQQDGSVKSAIINAVTLALMDAGVAMKDFLVSQTTGIMNGQIITDLTYDEQRACNGELIISYLPRTKKVDFMELNCSKLSTTDYDNLLDKNIISCQHLQQIMRQLVMENSLKKIFYSK